MKASLRWIREFVDLPTDDLAELGEVLSNLGIEVEGVERIEADFSGVVVAKVLDVAKHPNADKVRIATLDAGAGPVEVVCGAWNFEAGATVAYATVGAVLPGGFEVGEKEIRGVKSPGMICSEIEMGLGEEAGGILVLEDGYAEPGTDFAGTLQYPDAVFDLSITPNRPDAMSIHGIARDLAAHYEIPVMTPTTEFEESGSTNAVVRIEEPDRCPRFTAREVAGITVAPSPLWMRLRLRDVGVRAISNVVDVSNYVMLELGQPLHAFDLDRIPGETIVVRLASDGERLTTLDGVQRTLTTEDLVIAGIEEPLGLAGIMGGGDSEVSDSTTRALIEVAHFEPTRVLLSGKRHALRTEAVSRFERGVDPELPPIASARAAMLTAQLAGGRVVGGFVDEYPNRFEPAIVDLPDHEAERLLGVALDVDRQVEYLQRLGFEVEGSDPMRVTVPSYRPDVTRAADVVEEIVRIHGYNEIPSRLVIGRGGGLTAEQRAVRAVRAVMVGSGFYEILSFDFLGLGEIESLQLDPEDPRLEPVRIRNPLNEEQEYLRTTLLPGLLAGLRRSSQRNRPDASLFEVGSVFLRGNGDLPDQPKHLAFAATGSRSESALQDAGDYAVEDAIGAVEVLLGALGIEGSIVQQPVAGLHPGRSGLVMSGDARLGIVGELDPAVAASWDLPGRVIVGEFDMAALTPPAPRPFSAPSPYPPVVFDLAFDLPDAVPVAELLAAVEGGAGEDLERLAVFDVFRGSPLADGRKSVAVRLAMRNADRTLTDDELVPIRDLITDRVRDELGGSLRGG
jgi:phenylalanyl-tRNA synthetase beta chain